MERRTTIRYGLSANAVFTWQSAGRARLRAKGITRDISLLSAFISASTCPPVGVNVQVDIFLFLLPTRSSASDVRIRTEAQVLRIDRAENHGQCGFAISCSSPFKFWPPRISRSNRTSQTSGVNSRMVGISESGQDLDETTALASPVALGLGSEETSSRHELGW